MQEDFHYYATYCAAFLAGYSHKESLDICYSAQFVDLCSATLLSKLNAPLSAATTQLSLEMADARTDLVGLQNITRIWASFHFLPYDLYAEKPGVSRRYLQKYRLICQPNGSLVVDTVKLAKDGSLQAVGLAMHVLADTWAHCNFAGTPSLVINNTDSHYFELLPDGTEKPIQFAHSPSTPDDLDKGVFTNSLYQMNENSVMNLGHGRAGHMPDYSFMRYRYLPAWGNYQEIVKDNPSDYRHAFCQMIEAMKFLRGERDSFETNRYDFAAIEGLEQEIDTILRTRRLNACEDWKALGERLSGQPIEPFSLDKYQQAYLDAAPQEKDETFLGRFFLAALAQKSMVTNKIYTSGNLLAGYSVDYRKNGFQGLEDFRKLVEQAVRRRK